MTKRGSKRYNGTKIVEVLQRLKQLRHEAKQQGLWA